MRWAYAKEGFMNTTLTVTVDGIDELVRGQEEQLLAQLKPLVQHQSVRLDLERVERIDAAGIAGLIALYCAAHESGHRFTIVHATARVEEILSLVGVMHLFASEDEQITSEDSLCLALNEA
jgi:anti-anti-sigma factor